MLGIGQERLQTEGVKSLHKHLEKQAPITAAMEAAAEEGGDGGAACGLAPIIAEPQGMDEDER